MIFAIYADNVQDVDEICKTNADTQVLRFDDIHIPSHLQEKEIDQVRAVNLCFIHHRQI